MSQSDKPRIKLYGLAFDYVSCCRVCLYELGTMHEGSNALKLSDNNGNRIQWLMLRLLNEKSVLNKRFSGLFYGNKSFENTHAR